MFLKSLAILWALAGAADGIELDHLQSARADAYHLVDSETLERPFHIYVRLPRAYDETEKIYPVIYLLDGGTNYPMLTPYYLLLSIDEPMPDAIIVGISYGADSVETGNRRNTDYTVASAERDDYGGAEQYQTFLKTELLPMIDKKYRSDPDQRIIFGQSLAGQFVIFSALTDPNLFWGHIASNPAIHRNAEYFLAQEPKKPDGSVKMLIANGSNDGARYQRTRQPLFEKWATSPPPWDLHIETLEGEYHAAAAPLAFRAGMRWLFEDNP